MSARRSGPSWFRLLVVAVLVLAVPSRKAEAQSRPDVSASISSSQVEVGEPFTVELKALVERGGDPPSDPQLAPPAAFQVSSPRISTQTVAQFGGGQSSVKIGLGASWTLIGQTPGHFTIPAPTVVWGGKRLRALPLEVDVAPSTGRPRPGGANPFLLPGGPFQGFPGLPGAPGRGGAAELDDSDVADATDLALERAPDDKIFLRTRLDKKSAVVGEQVTASFWIYYRADFEMNERHDAPLADFVRVPLLKNPGTDPVQYAMVAGHRFAVRLLDRIALFPVHAGELHTGQMAGRFTGRRIGARALREANDEIVSVTDPPATGRPAGWNGAVGSYELSATVAPRRTTQGGSVAVTVRVSGTGNVPSELAVPARSGVEWLDPERREAIEPQGGVVKGWRSFGYVVRLRDAGKTDLGSVTLPFWDPAAKRWQVATAELGLVEVAAGAPGAPAPSASGSADAPAAPRDPFATLPAPRPSLSTWTAPPPPRLEGALLWVLVAAAPALYGLFVVGQRGARSLRAAREARTSSAIALSAKALRDATGAHAKGDAKSVAAAGERAVHHAIEAATGLKSRAVLLRELAGELGRRGVPDALAERARETLAACEALRFAPGASETELGDLSERVREVVDALGKVRRRAS